mgnify:CR=1 FL=1
MAAGDHAQATAAEDAIDVDGCHRVFLTVSADSPDRPNA